jgi:predicted nucleotidyltransferase component of viral defense system
MQTMAPIDMTRRNRAEAAQLIILQSVFSFRESKEVIFQGGTAIRWFHGGLRFSEDLDFVTSLAREEVAALVESAGTQIRRQLVANFGTGSFSIKEKKYHPSSFKAFIDFLPSSSRRRVSVKVEFEKLAPGMKPDMETKIMQASPSVSYFLQEGGLKAPGVPSIVNIETSGEILSDKLRALLERPYTKGRDFFDVWYLTSPLRVEPDAGLLRRKLDLYEVPFSVNTPLSFYAHLDEITGKEREKLIGEIHQDLSRFLDSSTLETMSVNGYSDLVLAVQEAFRKVEKGGMIDFSRYRSGKRPRK